jgi:predicted aspartyl protease
VSTVNRAFSAVGVLIWRILWRRPRFATANPFRLRTNPSCVRTCGGLAMIQRRWRYRILSGIWRSLETARPRAASDARARRLQKLAVLLACFAPISNFAAAKDRSVSPQLAGYRAVRVHYGPMNKMIMSVQINGQRANLLVDTGSNEIILDTDAAATFGIRPSPRGLRYVGFTEINGQLLPIAFMQSLTAGSMNFGSNPVVLRDSSHSDRGTAHVDGILGLQIMFRHKAVINCRTRLVFFKVDQSRHMNLSAVASSEKFRRVPMHRETSGALTVPCSIHGQSGRLLVDTGAFVTTFPDTFFKSLGISSEPTRLSAHFPTGTTRQVSAAQINDLKIGDFKVPSAKFGVTALPHFALRQGGTRISGILGMDTLYICHAIIDLDGMNLFLK